MTDDPSAYRPAPKSDEPLTGAQRVFLAVVLCAILALLCPLGLWLVGHWFLPFWHWGTSWM